LKTFVLGDIHGSYLALRQCLDRSGFNNDKDRLIFLGDVCDGWPQTRECIDHLLGIRDLVCLLGNHDFWFYNWMKYGEAEDIWLDQGGQATVDSYKDGIPKEHVEFLSKARLFHEEGDNLFVHAGIPPDKRPQDCSLNVLLWDESQVRLTRYEEVFIGHTPIDSPHPVKYCEVWMMDTGAGWSGVLSMMNVDTHECFTSDPVPALYPGVAGRKRR
jgi:serine/threonine protein phosphatase 1